MRIIRIFIGLIVGLEAFMYVGMGETMWGLYCAQYIGETNPPLVCIAEKAGLETLLVNVIGWLLLAGLPLLATLVYIRYGWPRDRRGTSANASRNLIHPGARGGL